MSSEQEQTSDAMWAIQVLNGRGDENDSTNHALWMLHTLSTTGCTETIRRLATSRIPEKAEVTA